jgi:hypothetical protein
MASIASSLAQPAPANESCSKLVDDAWQDQEKLVWQRICVGGTADFNSESKYGGDLNPKKDQLPETRKISAKFLETILLSEKYRNALPRFGVHIVGARFDELIDLKNAVVAHEVRLDKCRLDKGIDLTGADLTYGIAISNSYVRYVKMRAVKIKAYLTLAGDVIETGKISDDNTEVSIELEGAHIAGFVDLGSSTSTAGLIQAQSINVGGALYLNEQSQFYGEVDISFAKIGGSLDLSSATFHHDVDLSGTEIGGGLSVASNTGLRADGGDRWLTKWKNDKDGTTLYLRDAKANTISGPMKHGRPDPWPAHLDLDGLTYKSMELDSEADVAAIKLWLNKQQKYAVQPYEHLAQLFESRGDKQTATEIRYAARDRERRELAHGWGGWIWLTTLDVLIGYGYRPQQAIVGVVVMIVLGVAVLRISGQGPKNGIPYGIAYSFDMLLPIIKLREMHYKIDINGWARYYFYLHRVSGWLLASFLVAGISGLTK